MSIENQNRILIAGDYHIYGKYNSFINKNETHKVFSDEIYNMVKDASFSIFNMENPIKINGKGIEKFGPHGYGSLKTLFPIGNIGFDLATFASNHTYDMGDEGIVDTINELSKYGIKTIGAGIEENDIRKIHCQTIGNYKVAILNFARKEFNTPSDFHGGANTLDIIDNVNDIKKAKKNADIVLVLPHEGQDVFYLPYPQFVKQMRFYADIGADIIVANHSRMYSGYEIYNNTPIIYSLGNLLHFSVNNHEHNGLILEIDINQNKQFSLNFHPVLFDKEHVKVNLAKGKEKRIILENIDRYSKIIKDTDKLKEEWGEFIWNNKSSYLNIIIGWPHILLRIFRKLNMESIYVKLLLMKRKRLLAIWNIARCNAHFESMNYILMRTFKRH